MQPTVFRSEGGEKFATVTVPVQAERFFRDISENRIERDNVTSAA